MVPTNVHAFLDAQMHCLLVTIIYNQFLPVKLQAPLEETMTAPLATFCEITQKPVLAETDVARMERAAFVRSTLLAFAGTPFWNNLSQTMSAIKTCGGHFHSQSNLRHL